MVSSYISFEYALAFYELIPERVDTITCATFDKRKKKYLILCLEHLYQIATAKKALCDKLYTLKPLNNYLNNVKLLAKYLRRKMLCHLLKMWIA